MSAIVQMRTMGGLCGLAIVTTAMNSYVKAHLAQHLSSAEIGTLLESANGLETLQPETVAVAKSIFAQGYDLQMRITVGFSAAQLPVTLMMWKTKQILV